MPSKPNRILAMLKADHKKVKELFNQYEKADSRKQRTIAQTVIQELDIHAELEEQLIYPAIRAEIEDDALMNEAIEEHHLVHVLIEELLSLSPSEEIFNAKFAVLGEVVKHHIKEEEGEMFPQAQKSRIDWDSLYEQARMHREQLLAKTAA